MEIPLTPAAERLIADLVAAGRYASPADAVAAGLDLLEDHEALRQIRLEKLRKEVAIGIEQADRGETVPFDETTLERIKERALGRRETRSSPA